MVTKVTRDVLDLMSRPVEGVNFASSAPIRMNSAVQNSRVLATDTSSRLTMIEYSQSATADTIVQRTAAGEIVGTASSARWADLAERYRADADYVPGTVLILGGEFEVTQSPGYRDDRIFGVVSSQPGFILNVNAQSENPDEFWPLVGLVGRVLVRVVGPVKKYQRLVSSSIPGVATGVLDESKLSPLSIVGRSLVDDDSARERLILAAIGKM